MNFPSLSRDARVLHLFDDDDVGKLNLILGTRNSFESLELVGKHNTSSEDIWLIHVPFVDVAYLENIFRKTPLRLDSAVFAFSKDNEGWFKKLEMKKKVTSD